MQWAIRASQSNELISIICSIHYEEWGEGKGYNHDAHDTGREEKHKCICITFFGTAQQIVQAQHKMAHSNAYDYVKNLKTFLGWNKQPKYEQSKYIFTFSTWNFALFESN